MCQGGYMPGVAPSYRTSVARGITASRLWLAVCALGALSILPGAPSFSQAPKGQGEAPAAQTVSPELSAKLQKRGDLSLSNTTLQQALFTVSETWGINIVVGQDVQGNVNGQ